jgi:hypothetical protein
MARPGHKQESTTEEARVSEHTRWEELRKRRMVEPGACDAYAAARAEFEREVAGSGTQAARAEQRLEVADQGGAGRDLPAVLQAQDERPVDRAQM